MFNYKKNNNKKGKAIKKEFTKNMVGQINTKYLLFLFKITN